MASPQAVAPDVVLTAAITSQPDTALAAYDVPFINSVTVDPRESDGTLIVDRAVLDLDTSGKRMTRGAFEEPKLISIGDPSTVAFKTIEIHPYLPGAYKVMNRTQDPIQYEQRLARAVMKAAHAKRYSDVKDVLTTAGNWDATVALAAIVGGSAKQHSDLTCSFLDDLLIAAQSAADANGGMWPTDLVLPTQSIRYAQRNSTVRAALGADVFERENTDAIIAHIGQYLRLRVHEQTANLAGSYLWPASALFLFRDDGASVLTADGAMIGPNGASLIHERIPDIGLTSDFYIRRWDRPDGLVFNVAAVSSYVCKVVDNKAGYLVTALY